MFRKVNRKTRQPRAIRVEVVEAPHTPAPTIEGPNGIVYIDPEITAAAARAYEEVIDLRDAAANARAVLYAENGNNWRPRARSQDEVEAEARMLMAARTQARIEGPGGVVYTDPDAGAPSSRGTYGVSGFTPEGARPRSAQEPRSRRVRRGRRAHR